MSLTADSSRHQLISSASVCDITQLSHNVRGISLRVHDRAFCFHAGQWVDLMIPGTDMVGGYSICSAPHQLSTDRTIDLAVKRSEWPPAKWIHTQCRIGSDVKIRAGGDFYYAPEADVVGGVSSEAESAPVLSPLLLIAGGVGVNPLLSMLRHRRWLSRDSNSGQSRRRAVLLYSVRTADDLLFKEEMSALGEDQSLRVELFLSRQPADSLPSLDNCIVSGGRVTCDTLSSSLHWLNSCESGRCQLSCFVCGPVSLIDQTISWLGQLHVPADCVHFERWT